MKDLLVLVADIDTEQSLRGLLSRHESLKIRLIDFEIFVHPRRDPGCLREAPEFLRGFFRQYSHALVIFDHEGSGGEASPVAQWEDSLRTRLHNSGWENRAQVLILEPELEIWVWSDSPEVDAALGWSNRNPSLRGWLSQQGYLKPGAFKPERPKESMRDAMKITRKVPSAAVYKQIAMTVGLRRCQDPKFARLLTLLRNWFPV